MINMKPKYVILFVSIFLMLFITIFLSLYFSKFHNDLSSEANDWAAFGSYIGGVVTPVLTIINIGVFIWLTLVIKNSGEEQKKKELEHQKRLIITQMRKTEIAQLSKILDSTFVPENNSFIYSNSVNDELKINLMRSLIEIDSFLNEKQNLFPLDHNSSAFLSLIDLHKMIGEVQDQYDNSTYKIRLVELMKLKHNAIQALYQFTTDNIAN